MTKHTNKKHEETAGEKLDHVVEATEEKAKEIYKESKKSVEEFVDKVVDEEKMKGYWTMFVTKFEGATIKDWVIFVVGLLLFIFAMVQLAEFMQGIIALLLSVLLMNLFFNRD